MGSSVSRLFVLAAVLTAWFATPSSTEAALRGTTPGKKAKITARLSSNPVLRKQQLIVDPEGILGGSISVRYDPRIVSLSAVLDPAEFQITGGFVSVIAQQGSALTQLRPLDQFLNPDPAALSPYEYEGGFVQIFFGRKRDTLTRAATNSVIPNLPGYNTVDEDGQTGIVDTHALLFDYLPKSVDPDRPLRAAYEVFATPPVQGTVGDTLTFEDEPDLPVRYTEIESAFVAGDLGHLPWPPAAVPLPPAAWSGLILLVGVGIGMRWKRRHATA